MTTRKELVAALQLRYSSAAFGDRIKILDEFVALTGYHRKHAIRLLREKASTAQGTPARNRLYDEAVIWSPKSGRHEVDNQPCGGSDEIRTESEVHGGVSRGGGRARDRGRAGIGG